MSRDVSDSQEQGAGGTEQSDKAKVMREVMILWMKLNIIQNFVLQHEITDFQGLIGGGHWYMMYNFCVSCVNAFPQIHYRLNELLITFILSSKLLSEKLL